MLRLVLANSSLPSTSRRLHAVQNKGVSRYYPTHAPSGKHLESCSNSCKTSRAIPLSAALSSPVLPC